VPVGSTTDGPSLVGAGSSALVGVVVEVAVVSDSLVAEVVGSAVLDVVVVEVSASAAAAAPAREPAAIAVAAKDTATKRDFID